MKWEMPEPETNPYYLKSGPWTITKPGNPGGLQKPYGLWFQSRLIAHFATSQEAKNKAEEMTVTQI